MDSDQPPINHLRAWREYRGLTQTQLADAVGTTHGVISLLERGDRKLSDEWLRKLAPALHTKPGVLLDYGPDEPCAAILELWADIPEERRRQAIEILLTFRKASD